MNVEEGLMDMEEGLMNVEEGLMNMEEGGSTCKTGNSEDGAILDGHQVWELIVYVVWPTPIGSTSGCT